MARLPKESKRPATPPSSPYPQDANTRRALRATARQQKKERETSERLSVALDKDVAPSSQSSIPSPQPSPAPSQSRRRANTAGKHNTLSNPPRIRSSLTDEDRNFASTSQSHHRSNEFTLLRYRTPPPQSTSRKPTPLTPPPSTVRARKARQPPPAATLSALPSPWHKPLKDRHESTPRRRPDSPSPESAAILRAIEQLEIHSKCYLCDGFVGTSPYT